MKYISLDIETTSLDPQNGEILEIGLVFDDLEVQKPLNELERFRIVIRHRQPVMCDLATILFTNHKVIEDSVCGEDAIEYGDVIYDIQYFFFRCGFKIDEKITLAGKNITMFDLPFLEACIPGWVETINPRLHSRIIDPAVSFLTCYDTEVPNLATCLYRAGFDSEVHHTAMEDVLAVVQLVRAALDQ